MDGREARGIGVFPNGLITVLSSAKKVVGNFRATPTTEKESEVRYLQPYNGVVHNGTIANDKEIEDQPIDSMVLGKLMANVSSLEEFREIMVKIIGSYAIAFFRGNALFLGANYKPIHWKRDPGRGVCFASMPYMLPFDSVPFPPYTLAKVIDGGWQMLSVPRMQNKKVAVSCSGGLDSVTVLYELKSEGFDVTLVHFLYGCLAEDREVERVKKIAEHGGFNLAIIPVPKMILSGTLMNGHYYSDNTGLAGAEYAHDWVSARNLVMLALLTAFAESNGMGFIAFGGNLEESGAYPDNEEEFGRRFNEILPFATQNGVRIELIQPVANMMKHEIVKLGLSLDVPYELTWSCYGKGERHCGKCGPCYMRKVAFERNGVKDPVFEG
jgi:7-cyano-7-deazaguanine synthase